MHQTTPGVGPRGLYIYFRQLWCLVGVGVEVYVTSVAREFRVICERKKYIKVIKMAYK